MNRWIIRIAVLVMGFMLLWVFLMANGFAQDQTVNVVAPSTVTVVCKAPTVVPQECPWPLLGATTTQMFGATMTLAGWRVVPAGDPTYPANALVWMVILPGATKSCDAVVMDRVGKKVSFPNTACYVPSALQLAYWNSVQALF